MSDYSQSIVRLKSVNRLTGVRHIVCAVITQKRLLIVTYHHPSSIFHQKMLGLNPKLHQSEHLDRVEIDDSGRDSHQGGVETVEHATMTRQDVA